MKERILTGIKPTGYSHLGNYFGAIKPAIELSQNSNYDCFFFVADYHALTTVKTKQELENYTLSIASTWLACGLDFKKVVFFKQSAIPQDFELNWILNNVTPKGLLNRAHAYKALVEENEKNGKDKDDDINMGVYNYPILMTADIVLFNTNLVPVGLDQKQHIEIARDIVDNFNKRYGDVLVKPQEYIQKDVSTLVGLDGRKMSKSYNNTIQLFSTEKVLKQSVNKIVTTSQLPGEPKDPNCTINTLYKLFVSPKQSLQFEQELKNGLGWGEAKKQLFEVANSFIAPMREKYNYYMANPKLVNKILEEGSKQAVEIAEQTLTKVKKSVGAME